MTAIVEQKMVGAECRFAVLCPPPFAGDADLHVVKEIQHMADGTNRPFLRLVPNFKRSFWVTNKGARNHEQKKEWEELTNVREFRTTQSNLNNSIAAALGRPGFSGDPRQLSRSPYLYGSDILSTAVIKKQYQKKNPELSTPYSVAVFDTEKDMVMGTEQINMATLSFGKKVFTAVQKSFVEGLTDVPARAQKAMQKYLGEVVQKRGIEWELMIVDSEIDCVRECMNKAHAWMPDFVAIWNIDFDMPMMIKACERAGVDPKNIFSDPSVPPEYRHFKYHQGKKQKKTASGLLTPIKPADQWHTVYAPASFYFIDAMCAYRKIRSQKGEEPNYKLDSILNKELGIRKLNFKEAESMEKVDWHIFMQSNYKIEYIIYNVFDCVSMELLDEKTLDLSIAMPMQSGCSDFATFKSQPRRAADDLHFFCQDYGKVFGSTADKMQTELDDETLGLEDWIVTLPAHLVIDNGLAIIKEYPNLRTNIRGHVGDLDVSASYPNGEVVFNISKETTKKELCSVEGIPERTQRMQGVNLSSGVTNAVEFATTMYGLPNMDTLLDSFMEDMAKEEEMA